MNQFFSPEGSQRKRFLDVELEMSSSKGHNDSITTVVFCWSVLGIRVCSGELPEWPTLSG